MVSGGCFVRFWWWKGGDMVVEWGCRVERERGEGRERKSLESLVANENKMKILQFILDLLGCK